MSPTLMKIFCSPASTSASAFFSVSSEAFDDMPASKPSSRMRRTMSGVCLLSSGSPNPQRLTVTRPSDLELRGTQERLLEDLPGHEPLMRGHVAGAEVAVGVAPIGGFDVDDEVQLGHVEFPRPVQWSAKFPTTRPPGKPPHGLTSVVACTTRPSGTVGRREPGMSARRPGDPRTAGRKGGPTLHSGGAAVADGAQA